MISLTNEQHRSYEKAKNTTFAQKGCKKNILMVKNIIKLKTIVIVQVNAEVLPVACVI